MGGQEPGGATAARSGSGGRTAAIVIAVMFLLLIAAFVAMPFIRHDEARLNAVGPVPPGPGYERGGVVFTGTAGTWEVRGRMAIDAQRRVHFAFDLTAPDGRPAPAIVQPKLELDMPERPAEPLRPQVSHEGPGSYAAMSPLPAEGQWRARIELPDIAAVLLFTVAD